MSCSLQFSNAGEKVVLSGNEQAIFVFGGKSGKKWAKTLRWIDLRTGDVQERKLKGPKPRKVLAATFRTEDRSIYLVDEKRAWFGKRARLMRIDIGKHRLEVLGSWWRHPKVDSFFVQSTHKGELLLASSSSHWRWHSAFGLGISEEGIHIKWDHIGPKAFAYAPQWYPEGLNLPLSKANGTVKEVRFADPDSQLSRDVGLDSCF